jgi:predicted transcriptional regulator|nr:MAG TPA: antitoxin [Caudoviricetes sp.]
MKKRRKKRPLTVNGKQIKWCLLELDMTQAEFCRKYGIPQNRFCDICHSEQRFAKERRKIYEILGIEEKRA